MPLSLRVLLVAPPDAAADAVDRLRARGPVSPALVPTPGLLATAVREGGWDAVLGLPGGPVTMDDVAAALPAGTGTPLFVEATTCPPALAHAVHLAPGETGALRDHFETAAASEAAAPDAPCSSVPVAMPLPERGEGASGEAAVAPAWGTAMHLATRSGADGLEGPGCRTERPPADPTPPTHPAFDLTVPLACELPIGVYRSTPDGRVLYGNDACARVLGLESVEALYALNILTDLDYPREHFSALMASDGLVRNLITTWRLPDGRRVHTREHARAVRDDAGVVCCYDGTFEDVTAEVDARRAAERQSRQHEAVACFAAVADTKPSTSALFDEAAFAAHHALGGAWTLLLRRSGNENAVAAWAGPLSASAVSALAETPGFAALSLDALTVDEAPSVFQPLLDACACRAVATFPLMQGERTLGALVVAYPDGPPGADDLRTGEALAWHLAGHLGRLRAERDLSDSEATLRYVAEHADAVLFRQRADGTFDYVSPGIERLTGLDVEAFAGQGGLDGLATDRTDLAERAGASPEREASHIRYTVLHPDGTTRVIDARARPWHSADAVPLGRVGAYHDVTDHVEMAASLRDARDLAVEQAASARQEALQRSAALAELSHEIRTPLTGVIGFAEVLADELVGEHAEVAETIVEGGRTMLDTINAVLDHARLESEGERPDLVPIDLGVAAATATERLRPLADEKGLGLDIAVADDVVAALDKGSLDRIVTNLVGNAVKYTESGAVRVTVEADGDTAALHVRDSGIGIPESVREHLFEPFRAGDHATPNSSGLGLSIVKRLVDLLGGTISVENRAPGTEVSVRFARLHPPASPSAHPAPDPMTHPLPTSGDGQPDAPHAPHRGEGHAFVARPQPAPPAGHAPAPGGAAAPVPQAPIQGAPQPPASPAPQYAPPQAPSGYAAAAQPGAAPYAPAPAPTHGAPPPQPTFAPPHAFAPPPAPYAPQAAPPVASAPTQESFGAPQESFGAPKAPAQAPAPGAAPPAASPAEPSAAPRKARILVVEDNNDTRMLLDRILRRTYEVTAVGDARSALVAMHNTRFDGLVLDINLGGKETGADILRIARSLEGYQGVFAIALTAYALPGDRERLLEKGFSEYISKPFTRSSLMEALAKGVTV